MLRRAPRNVVHVARNDIEAAKREMAGFIERAQTLTEAIGAALDGAEHELAEIRRAAIPRK
jgi:hypothetical protein